VVHGRVVSDVHVRARLAAVYRKWIWASLAIIAMWAAVVLVGVYGPDLVVDHDTSHIKVPALAVVVALCALGATLVFAWRGFGEPRMPARPAADETTT
jgi:uncharacterized membrane protein